MWSYALDEITFELYLPLSKQSSQNIGKIFQVLNHNYNLGGIIDAFKILKLKISKENKLVFNGDENQSPTILKSEPRLRKETFILFVNSESTSKDTKHVLCSQEILENPSKRIVYNSSQKQEDVKIMIREYIASHEQSV